MTTEQTSAKTLKAARARAEGLNQLMTTIEMARAEMAPSMVDDPENRLAAEGEVLNWTSTNLAM